MPNLTQLRGTPVSAVSTSVVLAVATLTGVASQNIYVTDIQALSDKAMGTATLRSGTTILFQAALTGTTPLVVSWSSPIKGTVSTDVALTVTGTNVCYANISGYIL